MTFHQRRVRRVLSSGMWNLSGGVTCKPKIRPKKCVNILHTKILANCGRAAVCWIHSKRLKAVKTFTFKNNYLYK